MNTFVCSTATPNLGKLVSASGAFSTLPLPGPLLVPYCPTGSPLFPGPVCLPQVQLQLLTAIVKLFLKKPTETQELVQQVLSLATQVGARLPASVQAARPGWSCP